MTFVAVRYERRGVQYGRLYLWCAYLERCRASNNFKGRLKVYVQKARTMRRSYAVRLYDMNIDTCTANAYQFTSQAKGKDRWTLR